MQLAADNTSLVSNTSTFDTIVNIAGYGDVLETASANALGYTNKSRTDGAGRTLQSLDATGAITTFVYNANGQRLSVRDANNVGQDCTYDPLGRDLSCTDTAGAVTSRTYDLAGNVTTQTDAKGKLTSLVYDSRGRRTTLTDRIAAVTAWVYDAAGNELSMTDAQGQTTVYIYDNSGRRITIQWPDHVAGQNPGGANYGIEATAYDAAGRPFRKTNQLGDTITSTYDLAGRTLSRQYRTLANSPSGTVANTDTFTFDAASRLLTGVKGEYANTVAITYDAGGRKATEAPTIAGQTYSVGTAYDLAGRESQLTYPDGTLVGRTYDSRNLLSTITYGGGNIDTRTYDAGGRLSSETLGNGQVVTRAYLTGDNLPALIANAAVGNYGYGWEASPRRRPSREERGEDAVASLTDKTSETITGSMSGYGFAVPTGGYDDQNRLTAWNRTNGTKNQAWALSAVGDWNSFVDAGVTQARTHGPTHEILTMGSVTVTHDSRGNMTQDEQGQQLTWNADGMLASATVPAGSSTGVEGTHAYQYDALGRRVRKTTGGTGASDTVFVLNGQTVVAEYAATSAAASPLRKYVNASYVDEPVLLIDRTASGSTGAGTDERFYYHRNQQYSITALCDNSGAVVERYAYTAYGEPTILDGPGATTRTTSFINNPYLYTARAYDAETGLYYFRARMYEGRKGRFLGRDPLRYSRYPLLYSGQYLVKNLDPTGMDEFEVEPSRGRNRRVTLPPWEMDEDQILDWKQKCMQDCADYYFLKFWAGRALDSCMENCERFAATPYIGMRRRMAKRPFEYRIPCGCEAKSDRITGEPPSSPFPGSPHGLGGGYYEILPFPGAGTAVTAGGASPCAIVVVVCDNGVTRMHIGPQNFLDSIGRIRWGKNCRAIVCGGDNSQQSNCLHTDVIDELKDAGITVERVSPSQACGIDSSGNWVENNDIEGME